jgi:SDR family mycofactocin-dependent oxidoreductase
MGRLDGRVAFVTGGARGQGRSHVLRLAEEGADVIVVDLCAPIDSVSYPLASEEDLAETVDLAEKTGRRILARRADVRDREALEQGVSDGIKLFGRVDIVVANAGILPIFDERGQSLSAWRDALDVNLTGVMHTVDVALPQLIAQGSGGSIVLISSSAGLKGMTPTVDLANYGYLGYHASKHGVVGLMRAYASALASHSIRVNSVHPSGVATGMVANPAVAAHAAAHPQFFPSLANAMPVAILDSLDVSNAVAWLCSDEARYVTGVALPVDAGFLVR